MFIECSRFSLHVRVLGDASLMWCAAAVTAFCNDWLAFIVRSLPALCIVTLHTLVWCYWTYSLWLNELQYFFDRVSSWDVCSWYIGQYRNDAIQTGQASETSDETLRCIIAFCLEVTNRRVRYKQYDQQLFIILTKNTAIPVAEQSHCFVSEAWLTQQ